MTRAVLGQSYGTIDPGFSITGGSPYFVDRDFGIKGPSRDIDPGFNITPAPVVGSPLWTPGMIEYQRLIADGWLKNKSYDQWKNEERFRWRGTDQQWRDYVMPRAVDSPFTPTPELPGQTPTTIPVLTPEQMLQKHRQFFIERGLNNVQVRNHLLNNRKNLIDELGFNTYSKLLNEYPPPFKMPVVDPEGERPNFMPLIIAGVAGLGIFMAMR